MHGLDARKRLLNMVDTPSKSKILRNPPRRHARPSRRTRAHATLNDSLQTRTAKETGAVRQQCMLVRMALPLRGACTFTYGSSTRVTSWSAACYRWYSSSYQNPLPALIKNKNRHSGPFWAQTADSIHKPPKLAICGNHAQLSTSLGASIKLRARAENSMFK